MTCSKSGREPKGPPARPRPYLAASAFIFSLAASHSAWVISRNPMPLQEFWPLHALFAVLQADEPLHEFTPSQCVLPSSVAPSSAAFATATNENIVAAAAARARLERLRLFIEFS